MRRIARWSVEILVITAAIVSIILLATIGAISLVILEIVRIYECYIEHRGDNDRKYR